jgi:alkylhydroperoxidase family enzyme
VLDPVAAVGHNSPVGLAYGLFELQVERWRTLDRGLKDLAVMAAAATIGCSWCMDFGYWESVMKHDVRAEKIRAVRRWRDSDVFTELERLVLEYAEAMTGTPPTVTDEMVQRLRGHLSEGPAGRADRDRGGGEPAVADERRARAHGAGLQGPVRDPGGGGRRGRCQRGGRR